MGAAIILALVLVLKEDKHVLLGVQTTAQVYNRTNIQDDDHAMSTLLAAIS